MDARGTPTEASDERRAWNAWLRWVVYMTLGYFINGVLTIALVRFAPGGLALIPIAGAVGLVVVGFLQWLVLRRYIHKVRWWAWLLATFLGQVMGIIIGFIVVPILGPLIYRMLRDSGETIGGSTVQIGIGFLSGAVLGAVVGLTQWLVLRRHIIRGASWWIPATVVAMAITSVVPLIRGLDFGLGMLAATMVNKVITGVILGAITGIVLAWLLRKPRKSVVDIRVPQ